MLRNDAASSTPLAGVAGSIVLESEALRLSISELAGKPTSTLHKAVNLFRNSEGRYDDKLVKDLNLLNDAATALHHIDEPWLQELRERVCETFGVKFKMDAVNKNYRTETELEEENVGK